MSELDEQRKKVEELKKKILEQKKRGAAEIPIAVPPAPAQPQNQPAAGAQHPQAHPPQAVPAEAHKPVPAAEKKPAAPPAGKADVRPAPLQHAAAMVSLQAYVQALRQALKDGSLSKDEEVLLATLRKSMGISEEEHRGLLREIQLEYYYAALLGVWRGGSISSQDSEKLDNLREKFNISAEEHMKFERQVRQSLQPQK